VADDDEDDDDIYGRWGQRSLRARAREPRAELEKVPSEKGQRLMTNGVFGNNERSDDRIHRKKKLAHRLMKRELGIGSYGQQRSRNAIMKQVFFYL